jgi:uncharacterized protein (DUF433 family)
MSKRDRRWAIYGGQDPRALPVYSTEEAGHYLRIPYQTINSWVFGRSYTTTNGSKHTAPLVPMDDGTSRLSFTNLVELHVLGGIRRDYKVDMKSVRTALDYLKEHFRTDHPLAEVAMETDGRSLFVKKYGHLINASKAGQVAMAEILAARLRRIDRDEEGLAIRLFPFTRKTLDDSAPRVVAIDPRVAFGRPVLAGSRITTADVADRFKAGETPTSLAADYGRTEDEIWEAIRCELEAAA